MSVDISILSHKCQHALATLGGLTLMTFWAILCQITHIKAKIRFSIINEIERCWEVPSHKNFKKRRDDTYNEKPRSHYLRCWICLGIVMALTWCKWRGPCCTQKALTTETIDSWIILGTAVILIAIVGLAMRNARQEVRAKGKDKKASPENGNRK